MEYREYYERFLQHGRVAAVEEYGAVVEAGREYRLLRATTQGTRRALILSGFHGEEQAGPLTLLRHLDAIVEYANEREVGLSIYPCANPSGFEARSRYNLSGERPNNDFLRYQVAPGVWKGELYPGDAEPLSYVVHREGPKETRLLASDLAHLPTPESALDIHQDDFIQGALTYAYVFGDRAAYLPLMEAAAQHVEVARDRAVTDTHRTDAHGLIEFHDGSVSDYLVRRGTPYSATLETTTSTPLELCHQVNLIWILGFIDLALAGRRRP